MRCLSNVRYDVNSLMVLNNENQISCNILKDSVAIMVAFNIENRSQPDVHFPGGK